MRTNTTNMIKAIKKFKKSHDGELIAITVWNLDRNFIEYKITMYNIESCNNEYVFIRINKGE